VISRIGWRLFCYVAAFTAGGLLYFIWMMLEPRNDFVFIMIQSLCAIVVSASCTGVAALSGLPLRMEGIRRNWTPAIAFSILLIGLALLFLSKPRELLHVNFDAGRDWLGPHVCATLAGYFLTLFAIANWPKFWGAAPTPAAEVPCGS